ncbi:hypothetical protein GETHPA_15320 [Geothrix rubra]|uniref:Uncharacterized protein n=2 Tax=Geothrix rubra TaxID=2927977 RepID=A0ABQ5Q5G3_9BACT|nr:hypothetical protein GETHPA_15320 [Geothrix rubra]
MAWHTGEMRPRVLLPCLLALPALAAPRVQAPDATWITFTTAHYRIHCPAAFEAFGRDAAARVEAIHDRYLGLVGYVYPRPIDILILDPMMTANGMAFPLLRRPFVVLWKTPPEPDSAIGHLRSWPELVLTHELGHMHHLLWPARKPGLWRRWTEVLGPVVEKCPRWVIEGYATLLEGKLTGSGRPHGAFRAAVLRQWAREGKLTPYRALDGTGGFLGGAMAYLEGSAYLEWLERRAQDPKVFQGLWKRLASPRRRSFDEAFTATFGFTARDGYQRFCAEVTHDALELERRAEAGGALREGTVFTGLDGWTSDLSVSPDGGRLMALVRDPKKPGIYIWDLRAKAPAPEAPKDPEELPDHAPRVPRVPPTWRIPPLDGSLPWQPVWAGSQAVSFQLRLPDAEGVLRPQARRWTLRGGTPPAAVPAAKPPAFAWGEVDGVWNLKDAAGHPLTRTLSAAWDPAPTPDGKTLYFSRLTATGVEIRKLDPTQPALPAGPLPADPAPMAPETVLPRPDEPDPLPPPGPAPEPHPYRVGESLKAFSLAGYSVTPSGLSAQVGAGGNDILGRLNWQVLAGLGDGAGPRGGQTGLSWHGWRWAPSFQLFSVLARPSSQRFAPASGYDQERRGAELALTREDLGRPRTLLVPSLAFERVVLAGRPGVDRAVAGLRGAWGSWWTADRQGASLSGRAAWQSGRTGGQDWTLARASLAAGWINPWAPLTLRWEEGRLSGDPTALDRFHLGGVATSLLPESLDLNRLAQAALPAYTATGDRLRRLRGGVGLGPLEAYVEHSVVWDAAAPRPAAQRVAGLELDSDRLGLPLDVVRRVAGNLRFSLGIHRPLDGAMKDRTVVTLSVLLRP